MGDLLPFFVPPPATTTTPPASSAAAPEPAARARPRCRRVHFPDLLASPIWFPPASMAQDQEPDPPASEKVKAPASELEEDRMDLLWEDFNEELLAVRRAGGGSCSSESSDDGEGSAHSAAAAAGRAPAGCFPVLRPSARAGGAVGHYRRRAGSWVLLMRIFRRLFVVDKTISSAAAARRRRAINSAR